MRNTFYNVGAKALSALPPEAAHHWTIKVLRGARYLPAPPPADPILRTEIVGLSFPNPLGLAAGFDKNAETPAAMLRLGFGFVEVGAATPRPQPGNPRPRVFRLPENKAVINRYGFNNDGHNVIAARLRHPRVKRARERYGPVGVNLGANKNSEDRIEDYVLGVAAFEGLVDFYTVNISSPNTPGLRALQDKAALDALLGRVMAQRDGLSTPAPVFLKVAPDLADADKADIVASAREARIDGLIVSNTTIERPADLVGAAASEKGGLSGKPLFASSTALLREFAQSLDGAIPLIGVGGVASAEDAYEKILNGASLVQLYTALIYEGPGLINAILKGLPTLLKSDGFSGIAQAVGQKL